MYNFVSLGPAPAAQIHSPLKHRPRFRLEIVVHRVPQHFNPEWLRQRRVIELDLHVDDMRDPGGSHLRHLLFDPDPASDRNPIGHPCHVHALMPVSSHKLLIQKPHRTQRHPEPGPKLHANSAIPATSPKTQNLSPEDPMPEFLILPNRSPPSSEEPCPRLLPPRVACAETQIWSAAPSPDRCCPPVPRPSPS